MVLFEYYTSAEYKPTRGIAFQAQMGPATTIIDGLANGKFVVILRNVTKGEEGKGEYQIYGYAQGLTCSAGENDKYSEDTEGGWLMTLEETSAPKSAMFFYDTSSETTAAMYESLLTEAEE